MNKITLKRMSLRNFKGIAELDVEFRDGVTSVFGRNGTGKTTLFDAFTWVLFGKDSQHRERFQLMTVDQSGQEIPRLQHEVTLVLDINGKEARLTRRKNEKWTKKRGSAIEEKTGTEEERLFDDVPRSVKEWDEKIQEICSYEVFKYITSPFFFASQKADVQREMLVDMAGGLNDMEIARSLGNAEFTALLKQLEGKTMDEYKRSIAAQKKRIKAELEEYPIRIRECNSVIGNYMGVDFAAAEAELAAKRKTLAEINDSLALARKSAAADSERIKALSRELSGVAMQLADMQLATQRQLSQSYNTAMETRNNVIDECERLERNIKTATKRIADKEREIAELTARRNQCLEERKSILAESESMTFDEGEFRCPTCGRPYDAHEIDARRADLEKRFRANIAMRLERNKEAGMRCGKQVIAQATAELVAHREELSTSQTRLAEMRERLKTLDGTMPTPPTRDDVMTALNATEAYQSLKQEEQRIKDQLNAPTEAQSDNTEAEDLNEARELLQSSIDELNQLLGKREILESRRELIKEYESKMRITAEKLAELEGIEFTIQAFAKAKIEAIEQRINSLFSLVKFKLFETQLNGGWRETCEAMVGGVPYSSLNNAMRINAGLDIINAICKYCDTYAPIFVDNAEGVNELLTMPSQMIRLVVTNDSTLKIV